MTPTNHDLGFRPCNFPALSECIQFQSSNEPSDEASYGTEWHKEMAELLRPFIRIPGAKPFGPVTVADLQIEVPAHLQWAFNLVGDYILSGWTLIGVELSWPILDEIGNVLTTGTLDVFMWRDNEELIIDWKTGQKRDYSGQKIGYIMAVYDNFVGAESCTGVDAFVNDKDTHETRISWQEASTYILNLYDRWKERKGPHTINDWCVFCSLRGKCPAWLESAKPALKLVEDPSPLPFNVDTLKNNPAKLGAFMTAYKRLQTLVDDEWNLKDALKTHMECGEIIDGWTIVNVKGTEKQSVDPEKFLLTVVKQMGTAKAAAAIKVDVETAQERWAGFTKEPFPIEIKSEPKPGYSYIKQKSPKKLKS